MTQFYQPDLSENIDSPFIRDGANKLARRSYLRASLLTLFVGWCAAAISLESEANRKCRTHARNDAVDPDRISRRAFTIFPRIGALATPAAKFRERQRLAA